MSQPGVKYELLELERLLQADLRKIKDLPQQLHTEAERIRQKLIHEVFTFEDERHLERYIQYHQQALIRLLDKADALFEESPTNVKDFYRGSRETLNGLLEFVERHFSKYFDQDAKAPQSYLALVRKEARANYRKLQQQLIARKADPQLVTLVLMAVQKMADTSPERGTTYRKVMYAKEVQKELVVMLKRPDTQPDINEELRQLMYYLNCNSIKVITYHAHFINVQLEKADTRTGKLETLSLIMKNIGQAQVKPGIGYNPQALSLKSQLMEYLAVELEHHERLQQITRSPQPPDGNFMSGFKLKFDASVAQLAYLLKLLLETKIITNTNCTQLFQFVVRFVQTKKSEAVSFGSLRAKFYDVETGTRASVRHMLTTLISHIDRG
jgi:hypothetical protein